MKPGDENSAIANKKSKNIIKLCTIYAPLNVW
jgi:hypothetical protein